MKHRTPTRQHLAIAALFLAALLLSTTSYADIRLPAIIGDNMVLQQGQEVSIWGWADPGEEVMAGVSWHSMEWAVRADDSGRWAFKMAAPRPGGPYQITLRGKNTVTLENILAGEVWVCSGQSNMQWSVQNSANADQEIAAAAGSATSLST